MMVPGATNLSGIEIPATTIGPYGIPIPKATQLYGVDKKYVAGGVISAVSLTILGFAAFVWWKKRKLKNK